MTSAPKASGMVERVARAIDPRRWAFWDDYLARDPAQTAHTPESYCAESMDKARDAIAVMREPTEAQYDALSATGKMWRELDSKTVWQTYIDSALSEEVES